MIKYMKEYGGRSMSNFYLEEIDKKLNNPNKNVFICYRGMKAMGGAVAQILYYNLLCCNHAELVPFCAPLCNDGVDFEQASCRAIAKTRVFIIVINDDFCTPVLSGTDKLSKMFYNADDQVRKELLMLCNELLRRERLRSEGSPAENLSILPVFAGRAYGGNINKFLQELTRWLWTEKNAKRTNELAWESLRGKGYAEGSFPEEKLRTAFDKIVNKLAHQSNAYSIDYNFNPAARELINVTERVYNEYIKRAEIRDGEFVWIGTRLSDIGQTGSMFAGAVTLFGETDERKNLFALCDEGSSRRVDHNKISEEQDQFLFDRAVALANSHPRARFYFYNQSAYYNVHSARDNGVSLGEALGERYICVNAKGVLDTLSDKQKFHRFCDEKGLKGALLDVAEGSVADCKYATVCKLLGVREEEGHKFILQRPIASGGNGTYIMTRENSELFKNFTGEDKRMLFSVYREDNVPVNLHAILFKDGVLFTPGSIQIMRADYEKADNSSSVKRLMYRGADFVEYDRLARLDDKPENRVNGRHIAKFKELCAALCEKIRAEGYRGILGIDGMIYGNEVKLLEVNCRFQASSALVNRALAEQGFPSLQEINLAAWKDGEKAANYAKYLDGLRVEYSNYSYNYTGDETHALHVFNAVNAAKKAESGEGVLLGYQSKALSGKLCFPEADGYRPLPRELCKLDDNAHFYRLVFRTNICWANEDGGVNLDECVCEPMAEFKEKICEIAAGGEVSAQSLLALKIALLTQGVNVSAEARRQHGGLRPATNDAVDLQFGEKLHGVVINAPLSNKFQDFSPFRIDVREEKYFLSYYGNELCEIRFYPQDQLANNRTSKGFLYSQVAYLSTDRLRVHVTNSCIYKAGDRKKECKFCNIERDPDNGIDLQSIEEVVRRHWADHETSRLRHFLIGGQSPAQNAATIDKVVSIIKIIKNVTKGEKYPDGADVYAMILPCDEEGIRKMREAGLDQLSFNIEIFDERCAAKYMPGKSENKRETYKEMLLKAQDIWFKTLSKNTHLAFQQIRSMVILGLEPRESFAAGMDWMIGNGIQPIISLFRPLRGTPLEDCVAPSMAYVYKLYFALQKKIDAFNEKTGDAVPYYMLGPDCICCQNNTLSLPRTVRL